MSHGAFIKNREKTKKKKKKDQILPHIHLSVLFSNISYSCDEGAQER